jgi:hypothetical protein
MLNNIMSSMKSEFKNLTKSDVAVLCRVMLDVARDNAMKGFSSTLQLVKNSEQTNVIIMGTPDRIDLGVSSCLTRK